MEKLKKKDYCRWYGSELQRYCGFRLLKSQRETALSPFLEHARAVRTWQSFDYNLWRACLQKPSLPRAAAEALFLQQVLAGELVLGWSGAVPWWGLLQCGKTLKQGPETPQEKRLQSRGPDNDEARKFRITLELRQVLKDYCSKDPTAAFLVFLQESRLQYCGGTGCSREQTLENILKSY